MKSADTTHAIFDLPPPEIGSEEIEIRGRKIAVHGIGSDDWVALYKRYPELVRGAAAGITAVNGNASPLEMVQMEAAICAAGFGHLGNAKVERAAITNLSRDERQQVMMAAINLSRPGDALSPLLEGGAAAETESIG